MVHPEQESIDCMQDIFDQFSRPGELVVDLFSSAFVAAYKSLVFLQRRRFVSCKFNVHCFGASTEPLGETFARKVLN